MDVKTDQKPVAAGASLPMGEFIALVALMMGLTALAIDFLLPAFPPIAQEYGVVDENRLQLLVYIYMIGFALTQLVYGPLSDMVGRRPTLLGGMLIFAAGSLLALFATDFNHLIVGRFVQGMGAAAARVLAVSIVRDRFGGREMARVMSFVMMVFIVVPVFAPALGGVVLVFGDWRLLFTAMLAIGAIMTLWFGLRMPETLHPEYRMPFSLGRIWNGVRLSATTRASLGYGTAMGLMLGNLMGYVGSSQQIFETGVYNLGPMFPAAFGVIAGVMGIASFINSRLVERVGMRRLSHGALSGYVAVSALQLALAVVYGGHPPLVLFGLVLACNNFLFSLTIPNFNAIAMEPLGAIAGTASSLLGFYTTLMGALLGLAVGQAFDGTVTPLGVSFFLFSAAALGVVAWTEKGRLFAPLPSREHGH